MRDFGEDWSSVGKVLGMGVGVKDAGKDMNTEGSWRIPGGMMSQNTVAVRGWWKCPSQSKWFGGSGDPGGSEIGIRESSETMRTEEAGVSKRASIEDSNLGGRAGTAGNSESGRCCESLRG